MKKVALLLLTYNRLEYTKLMLEQLWRNTPLGLYDLTIVDNPSPRDDTRKYLIDVCKDKPDIRLILNEKNEGLSPPTNRFWRESKDKYEFLGKVDNDTLVPKGWLEEFLRTMDKLPQLVMISAIHFWDWKPDMPLQIINGIRLYFPSHTGGCCYLMRSSVIDKVGYLNEHDGCIFGWTLYQNQIRKRGFLLAYHHDIHVELLGGETHSPKSLDNTPKYQDYNKEIYEMRKGHL